MTIERNIAVLEQHGAQVEYTPGAEKMHITLPDGQSLDAYVDWNHLEEARRRGDLDQYINTGVPIPDGVVYADYNPYEDTGMSWSIRDNFDVYAESQKVRELGPDGRSFFAFTISVLGAFVVFALLATITYTVWKVTSPPCNASVEVINECHKMIVRPDCSAATFDICYNEPGTDTDVLEGRYTSDWSEPQGNDSWILLILGIGGLILLSKMDWSGFGAGKKKKKAKKSESANGTTYSESHVVNT